MQTSESSQADIVKALPLSDIAVIAQQLAGKSNLLVAARQTQKQSAEQLRSLFSQAPTLRHTLHSALQAHLPVDPYQCGLHDGNHQVTMLTFAARLMASPVFANPFTTWSTWGFDNSPAHARWTVADWTYHLTPIVNAARLHASDGYWAGRMPGTAVSRQKHACDLLRQHFSSSVDIAFGIGELDSQDWQQGKQPELCHAQVEWRFPSGRRLISTAALSICPQPSDTRWLIYRPSAPNTVLSFDNLESMRDWIFLNRSWFWSDPGLPISTGTRDNVIVTRLHDDGFNAAIAEQLLRFQEVSDHHLLQACKQSETAPLDWSDLQHWEAERSAIIQASLSATVEATVDAVIAADIALADEEVHFACLEDHTPIGWRNQCVEHQATLLEQYLDGQVEPASAKVTLLREGQTALDLLQDSLDTLLLELPDQVTDAELLASNGEQTRAEQIAQGLSQALLKEARLQNALGDLSATQLDWVEQLVDRPVPSLQRHVQVSTLELVAGAHTWQLRGYMTFRAMLKEDEEPEDDTLLLYRPGQSGGLMAFRNEAELTRRLLTTLHGAWPDALLESALPTDTSQLFEVLANSPTVTLRYPPVVTHFMQHCVQSIISALPANATREQTRRRLCVSENRARTHALARFVEQNRSSYIQPRLTPLQHLGKEQLTELASQVGTLERSLQASGELLKLSLPPRQQFARFMLQQHLRSEFDLQTVPQISLDIADSVTTKMIVTGQSALGGAGSREVAVFSEARSEVLLESFMLRALDDNGRLRLGDATVKFEPANNPRLQNAITPAYIANLIEQMDLAGSYEKRIINAYLGFAEESPWQVQWRQETYRTPYQHRLRLLVLSRPTSLDANGQRLLEQFCQEQADTVTARTIAYHSVMLRPGVAADGSSDSVELSAIYVIKGATGPVLLYMPDAPNGKVISQYTSSDEACQALQTMALDNEMARFLATRSLSGDPDHHESYINTALQKNFRGFIGIGLARSESLPTHESHLDMGERIREHRATSRSQADLALSATDTFDHYFFKGLKLALSFLPGMGTAIALYDGWQAANAAVWAFETGNVDEGLQHLTSLLQSLTDAILTLAPLATTVARPVPAARLLTQQRQRAGGLRPVASMRKMPPNPFAGYEVELPTGPMVRSTHPQGAGVFQHVETRQHYIARNNVWHAVEWDPTNATWRLTPQGIRAYRQAVRLSDQGIWDTPGRLSGLLVDNGLAGGGGALTTLYNHGVAYWRMVLRRQPPRLTGMALAHDINDELKRIVIRQRAKEAAYNTAKRQAGEGVQLTAAQKAEIVKARKQLSDELQRNIEFNSRSIARLREHRATLSRADYTRFTALCEENISEMIVLEMHLVSDRFIMATNQVRLAINAIQALPGPTAPTALVMRLTQDSLMANREMIATLREVEHLAVRHHARRNVLQGSALAKYLRKVDQTGLRLDVANAQLVQASILSSTLFKTSAVEHSQMNAFMGHFHEQGVALRSTLYSHLQMPNAGLTRAQERIFLTSAQSHYKRFLNHVTAWEDNFQDLLSPSETEALRQLLRQFVEEIENTLGNANAARPRPTAQPGRGTSRPRLFETVDGPLIGEQFVERGQTRMRINQPNSDQPHTVYAMNEAGRWQIAAPQRAAPAQSMSSLVKAATARLDDVPRQQARLRQYQTPQALPVDLEDIAEGHAQQLRFIAASIREKAGNAMTTGQTALTQSLEAAAEQMQTLGRQLRIAQTKATSKPTVGYLQYLLDQQEVEIAWSRTLSPKLDRKGRPIEYLEEYSILDRSTRQVLWYAHFHFRQKPAQGFTRLEAGHLKLASERDLGDGAWRGSMTETQATTLFGGLRPAS
ncbi:dermonecrotic toxin domain-containing protein [Pseudomonas sp. TE21394]